MSTLAEFMILSGGDNCPPMLEKHLYDSWKSIMELYMQNREHGRMILESVEHADCDLKETNIILQGLPSDVYSIVNYHRVAKDLWERVQLLMQVNTKFLNSLQPEWSKFVTDVKRVRDLHTTNFDQLHAYLEKHELYANEVRIMRERNQDPLALIDSGLAIPVFKQGDDPIDAINKMMSFPSSHLGRQSSFAASASRIRANISGIGGTNSGQQRVMKCFNYKGEADPRVSKGPVTQTYITHNVSYQADDLDAYDSDGDDFSIAKAVLMANLSNYKSDVLSEVPHSENTHNDMLSNSARDDRIPEPTPSCNCLKNEMNKRNCNKCLELEAELIKQHNMVEKDEYNRLSKSFSKLEQHCISFELAIQLNKEIFQKNDTSVNQTEPTFNRLFKLNNLKAELQAKDTTIEKLKANIKRLNKTSITNSVKKDIDEIKTINIELEHRVAKLIPKNEHLKQTYKQLYDSIKPSCVRAKEHVESLVNQLNQKSVEITDLNAQLQEKHSKLNINYELMFVKCNSSMFDARHELCFLEFVSDMNASSKSKSVKKAKKKEEWKPTRKEFTKIRYNWRPTGRTFTLVGNVCPLTRITTTNKVPLREPIPLEVVA
ncbi:hypothetical protein Tco_0309957 [Tanacetum coccineum]